MSDFITLEDVGSAEQLLQRLLQERRVLEAGVKVLATYRATVSALQPALEELSAVELAIQKGRQELAGIRQSKSSAIAEAEEVVKAYKQRRVEEVQKSIDELLVTRTVLMTETTDLIKSLKDLEERYKETQAKQEEEYNDVARRLDDMKREHTVLSEAIGKAAVMFRSS